MQALSTEASDVRKRDTEDYAEAMHLVGHVSPMRYVLSVWVRKVIITETQQGKEHTQATIANLTGRTGGNR